MDKRVKNRSTSLPQTFQPLLWSYDFPSIDPVKDAKTVIIQTINYGDRTHWHWIKEFYGSARIRQILEDTPVTTFRDRGLRLAAIIFRAKNFNHALRGTD